MEVGKVCQIWIVGNNEMYSYRTGLSALLSFLFPLIVWVCLHSNVRG